MAGGRSEERASSSCDGGDWREGLGAYGGEVICEIAMWTRPVEDDCACGRTITAGDSLNGMGRDGQLPRASGRRSVDIGWT